MTVLSLQLDSKQQQIRAITKSNLNSLLGNSCDVQNQCRIVCHLLDQQNLITFLQSTTCHPVTPLSRHLSTFLHIFLNVYVYLAWAISSCCNFEIALITLHEERWVAGRYSSVLVLYRWTNQKHQNNIKSLAVKGQCCGELMWSCVSKAVKLNSVCNCIYKQWKPRANKIRGANSPNVQWTLRIWQSLFCRCLMPCIKFLKSEVVEHQFPCGIFFPWLWFSIELFRLLQLNSHTCLLIILHVMEHSNNWISGIVPWTCPEQPRPLVTISPYPVKSWQPLIKPTACKGSVLKMLPCHSYFFPFSFCVFASSLRNRTTHYREYLDKYFYFWSAKDTQFMHLHFSWLFSTEEKPKHIHSMGIYVYGHI